MFIEDIPTTKENYKKKEKEWLGFERALTKIGLDKDDVLDRIKRGLPPYKNKEDQKRKCEKVYKETEVSSVEGYRVTSKRNDDSSKVKDQTTRRTKTNYSLKGRTKAEGYILKTKNDQKGRKGRKTTPIGINTTMHRRTQRDLQSRTKVGRM